MMRAKMKVVSVEKDHNQDKEVTAEHLVFTAVSKSEVYPEDGSDENNNYARFTPMADLSMTIQNLNLFGNLKVSDEVYLDFTKVE
jgi:hypothetical protein